MKIHQLARSLGQLEKFFQSLPNQSLKEFEESLHSENKPSQSDIPLVLSALLALSDIDKNQWQQFIAQEGLPIEIRPRDASRDVIGKILRYLEKNNEARNKLSESAKKVRTDTSPELQKALRALLG